MNTTADVVCFGPCTEPCQLLVLVLAAPYRCMYIYLKAFNISGSSVGTGARTVIRSKLSPPVADADASLFLPPPKSEEKTDK